MAMQTTTQYLAESRQVLYTRSDTPGVQTFSTRKVNPLVVSSYRDLVDRPDWKVLVSKRLNASNPYTRYEVKIIPSHFLTKEVGRMSNVLFNCDGSLVCSIDPTYLLNKADDNALMDLALARLKQKLSNRSNQVNLIIPAVELGELRGTIKAIAYSAVDLVHALIQIKKTKGKSAAQFASHAWLQWSFALSPTIAEAQEITESIDTFIQRSGGDSFTDYGAARKEWKSRSTAARAFGYNSTVELSGDLFHRLSYRYTAGYRTPLRGANDYSAREQFGLELGALVPALWELTAFSWLADYFGTIGAYLEDTFVSDQLNTDYVVRTKRYTCRGQYSPKSTYVGFNNGGTAYVSGRSPSFEVTETIRTPLAQLPRRQLRFKTVDEIGKNAINKVLNLGSILVGGKALSNAIK